MRPLLRLLPLCLIACAHGAASEGKPAAAAPAPATPAPAPGEEKPAEKVAEPAPAEPAPRVEHLVVDHAWVKDGTPAENAKHKKSMEALRKLVVGGKALPEAWRSLNLPGDAWHIGDHESYPLDVLPPQLKDAQPGSVSQVVPGNEGLHLFKVFERKQQAPAQ